MRGYLLEYDGFFACWSKAFPATQRNHWGGLESEPVTLYTNGVHGGESWMYMVIVVPAVNTEVCNAGFQTRTRSRSCYKNASFSVVELTRGAEVGLICALLDLLRLGKMNLVGDPGS